MILAACTQTEPGGLFRILGVETVLDAGRLDAVISQRLELSPTAREALLHGVPLTLELELVLRRESDRTRVAETSRRFELRYLPLSEHYRVASENAADRNFPRLRHALSDLGTIRLSLQTGPLPSGQYEVLVRSRLDPGRLPPPMRLPALLDRNWAHESGWTSWTLPAGTGA